MAHLNPYIKFEIILSKSILLKQYENDMSKGPPNPGFMQEKALARIEKLFLF